jgi:hypothetical protein
LSYLGLSGLLSSLSLFGSVFCLYAMRYAPCAMHSLGGAAVTTIKHRAER